MPLAKKSKTSKGNQGAQWGDTGSAGNIKHNPRSMGKAGSPDKGPVVNRHGRDKSIGRGRKPRMRNVNPE